MVKPKVVSTFHPKTLSRWSLSWACFGNGLKLQYGSCIHSSLKIWLKARSLMPHSTRFLSHEDTCMVFVYQRICQVKVWFHLRIIFLDLIFHGFSMKSMDIIHIWNDFPWIFHEFSFPSLSESLSLHLAPELAFRAAPWGWDGNGCRGPVQFQF